MAVRGTDGRFVKGHTFSTEMLEKISASQKERWNNGAYENRILNYDDIAIKTRDTQRRAEIFKCEYCGKDTYQSPSHIQRGGRYCSKKCAGLSSRNEKHWNWKGGSQKRPKSRIENVNWRKVIFLRDNFTCQYCGERGGYLHAHHIKSWKNFPELRYEVSNGLTLCKDCHYELHRKRG